jgi:hypothetical protein
MLVVMCLRCVCGCGKVVCLVVVSFYIRILFNSLCVMFDLVFVFPSPLHYLLVSYFCTSIIFKQVLLKFIFALQCNSFLLQFI